MKRPSGGESVFISPRMMIISHSLVGKPLPRSSIVFRTTLLAIADALRSLGVEDIWHRGISYLAICQRKILGCAIYRKTNLVLYHAVLNLAESPTRFAKCLTHPQREPDYRHNRPHDEFVTSLALEGYNIPADILKAELSEKLLLAWK